MKWIILVRIPLLIIFFMGSNKAFSQNFINDTSRETASFQEAVNLYHQFLSPETGLYDGSEYPYSIFYPVTINEGHPFFESKDFVTGAVFYNNILYKNVPLLYDIIQDELLINDPSMIYILRLNNERIGWFTVWGQTFIRLTADNATNPQFQTGFYNLLYNGKTSLYKRVSKIIKENSASAQGINKYVVELNTYFIKKDNQYYEVKNKKSLIAILNNKKKEIIQFIKKNKLNLRKNKNDALIKIVPFYDGIYQ